MKNLILYTTPWVAFIATPIAPLITAAWVGCMIGLIAAFFLFTLVILCGMKNIKCSYFPLKRVALNFGAIAINAILVGQPIIGILFFISSMMGAIANNKIAKMEI